MTRRRSAASAAIFARHAGHPDDAAAILSTARDPRRVTAGHIAQGMGASWERWLSDQHDLAWRAGLARVRHVGPPIARTGPGGENILVVGNGPADYQGQIRAPGWWRPLAIEAKSYAGRLQRHEIAAHQHEDLALTAGPLVRGVALVVIELHDDAGRSLGSWALPYAELEARWRVSRRTVRGRVVESRSVGPDELAGWEIDARGIYLARFAEDT